MTTTPYNEAGITATFAAIFARLDALEAAKQPDPWPTIEALITRIEELEAAEHVEALHRAINSLGNETAAIRTRIAVLNSAAFVAVMADYTERLESARIAPRSAPESTETGSGVPMEPGNATRPLTLLDPHDKDGIVQTNANKVAAALRMYRKVQACKVVYDDVRLPNGTWSATAAGLLAWLKEGEA